MKRLRSLQEQCRSKSVLLERPFCNIGQTSRQLQTPVVNGSESLQQNFVEIMSSVSSLKQNSNMLSSNCIDITVKDDQDLPAVTENLAKRSHSEIDNGDAAPGVDYLTSPAPLSPARKRCRQDTLESVVSENIGNAAASPANITVAASEKLSAFVTSPVDKSFDSTNVELSLSAICEPSNTSAAPGICRSGSGTQLTSVSRPASAVRSANSSPRTWSSRRDLGWTDFLNNVFLSGT